MENLTPPLLSALREVKWRMSAGKSMSEAFQIYLGSSNGELEAKFRKLWILKNQSVNAHFEEVSWPTYYQRAFWEIVQRGARGEPCLEALKSLEDEVERAAQAELDDHLALLPFKVLIPLLLFQFPAYLLLLLGPLVRELQRQIGG